MMQTGIRKVLLCLQEESLEMWLWTPNGLPRLLLNTCKQQNSTQGKKWESICGGETLEELHHLVGYGHVCCVEITGSLPISEDTSSLKKVFFPIRYRLWENTGRINLGRLDPIYFEDALVLPMENVNYWVLRLVNQLTDSTETKWTLIKSHGI